MILACAVLASGLAAQPQWRAIPGLTDREGHAMATDPLRQRVVLFGGVDSVFNDRILGDTWEWDGTTWVPFHPTVSPPPRFGHAMAYDPVRKTVLLFGGISDVQANSYTVLGDTWEWDGQNWTQLFPAQSPSPRYTQMATDYRTGKVVLFGGGSWPLGVLWPVPDDETWEWDGATWTQHFPATIPAARIGAAMSADPSSGMVAMFGGFAGFELPEQTLWFWSGTDWFARNATPAPSQRGAATMVSDLARGLLLLHGGNGSGPYKDDTWIWNGSGWRQAQPATVPPMRRSPKLAYDAVRDEPILFGGGAVSGLGGTRRDTWSWDGTDWVKAYEPVLPSFGLGNAAYDAARDELVLPVMELQGPVETWVLRGHEWVQLSPASSPPRFYGCLTTYATAAGVVVLLETGPYASPQTSEGSWTARPGATRTRRHPPARFAGRFEPSGCILRLLIPCGFGVGGGPRHPYPGFIVIATSRVALR